METPRISARQPQVKWLIDDQGQVTTIRSASSANYCGCYPHADGSLILFSASPEGLVQLVKLVSVQFYDRPNNPSSDSSQSDSSLSDGLD